MSVNDAVKNSQSESVTPENNSLNDSLVTGVLELDQISQKIETYLSRYTRGKKASVQNDGKDDEITSEVRRIIYTIHVCTYLSNLYVNNVFSL